MLLFPGQGSQAVGMAEHLWETFAVARDTFAEAADALGWDIGELCRDGSMEELTRTDRTQLGHLRLQRGHLAGAARHGGWTSPWPPATPG